MRDHTSGLYRELTSSGNNTIAITPSASQQPGKFNISGVDPMTADMRNYAARFWIHLLTTFDPDAAGNAVNWDKLYKGLASAELISPVFGTVFPHKHTRGAVLGHIIQVFGLGYQYPQGARTQIPASTDVDVTLDLFYAMPIAHECLAKAHETAQWVGFYDNGTLEAIVDVSTVYDGDYAGAVIKTPTTLRAEVEYFPSPDEFLGVPIQWREREIAGGGSSPVLKNVGGEANWNGVRPGCGLMALLWLSDATGIGLNGPDGVDNFTGISVQWRGQQQILDLDNYFHTLKIQAEHRVGPRAGLGTSIVADGAGWPSTMAVTTGVDNRPAADSQKLFLPIIVPGRAQETTKVQRVLGDLIVNFQVTAAITSAHRFVTAELLEFDEATLQSLAGAAKFSGNGMRKELRRSEPKSEGALRYTRYVFN